MKFWTQKSTQSLHSARVSAWAAVAVGVVLLLVAQPAFAAPGEASGFPWLTWGVSVVNLLIFIGIIYKAGGAGITEFFKKRRATLLENLDEARELREEAQARLEEYSARLDSLEAERKTLLEEYHMQGEREKKRIIEDAKAQVDKMRADAKTSVEQEIKKAVASLERQMVEQAVEQAETIARDQLDAGSQKTLLDNYAQELSSMDASKDAERAA